MPARLNGQEVPYWQTVVVPAGSVLELQAVQGPGCRTYIAIQGGLPVPMYLGSRSTFTLGQLGGHGGRALRTGDVLPLTPWFGEDVPQALPPALIPTYTHTWEIAVMVGPHAAPDFFTPDDMALLFSHAWVVHHNSNRTGIRLIGPKPTWARPDGGKRDCTRLISTTTPTPSARLILPAICPSSWGATARAWGICLPGHHRAGGVVENRATQTR